ncbi:hypothetical protein [Marinobacter litoralis]|uniref:hypothetical protein n=1 Tax=Marinobacter litoralis TaxID=187981 RepID=UPI0018EAD68A|nr:hypothetical protein [Marinobacter litoralis]MBJ6137941.1 hypothetical protein [Marinobacter litoralis]
MGNRGVLHNGKREVTRQFKTKAWITCLLEFKGRKRELMTPGRYTELFFLDEVTAFAAGHRPCAECRRKRYNEFRDAWQSASAWTEARNVRSAELDEMLHEERIEDSRKITWKGQLQDLPHGTMVLIDNAAYAISENGLLAWNASGYRKAVHDRLPETVEVLTPSTVVKTFSRGFRPVFHHTAEV